MKRRGAALLAGALLAVSCTRQIHNVGAAAAPRTAYASLPGKKKAAQSAVAQAMARHIQNAVDAGDGDVIGRQLRHALEKDPSRLDVRLELAAHYKQAGSPELAIEHYRLAAARFPESQTVAVLLAETLADDGQTNEALGLLERFAEGHPGRTGEVPGWIALLRDKCGDYKGGESAHRLAVTLSPGDAVLHNNLGYNLLTQGRIEEATREFTRALEIRPRYEAARNNLGIALASDQKQAAAVVHLQSVSDPATAHNNLAAILIEQGKYKEARKELETALQHRKDFAPALRNLFLVAEMDGGAVVIPKNVPKERTAWQKFGHRVCAVLLGCPDSTPKRAEDPAIALFDKYVNGMFSRQNGSIN